jgi:SET domain-containing protein
MIEVRVSAIHGRGAFALANIRPGSPFHLAHLLVFPCSQWETIQETLTAHYVFHVEDCPDHPERSSLGLAMSPMSFVNHSRTPNAGFQVNVRSQTITFTALRAIAAEEEITIDYGDFAEKLGIA